ncbi:methyltransferase family protein [Mycobacterium sp. JS623]|uniref:class I SAM-dependent methyltransferase n=1 Tax=Mycobacterium sp. JS623 TaxID=212767 RepID=UPI0002A58C93|nr:class I SAM-dependent methyltransferase [Mycobacterium sp. JS623]AGB21787.1 methyltransferase family protein [Mycobacterium sp. JS623]
MSESPYQSGEYLANNPDWHAEDSPFKAQWIADILVRNHVAPKHVVEVGTGSGEILVQLRDSFPAARLEGYDISPQAHAIAARKSADRLTFHHADYLTSDGPAPDVVMAIDVFEHVDDYMGFLRAMKSRAEWKVFHIPLDLSAQAVLRGKPFVTARESIGHLHYFTKDTALAVLADCGYEVVDWFYTHGAETLPHRSIRTKITNIPRRMIRAVNEDFGVRLLGGASIMVLAR